MDLDDYLRRNNDYNLRMLCDNYSEIENFELALKDNFEGWECHHRLETHTSDGCLRYIPISMRELVALDMYYHRPPEELIYMRRSEHRRLHGKLYYAQNKERIKKERKRRYSDSERQYNKDKYRRNKDYWKDYYERNKERIKQYSKEYYANRNNK